MVLIKSTASLVHGGVLLPGLGDHHHHGLGDGVARHGEELQAVVKRGGVGLTRETDGIEFLEVFPQDRRGHHALARFHPVVVAFDGVDLAVVGDITVGVGQGPLGEGIGGKALVHKTQSRDTTRVGQVIEIGAHLVSEQETFVDHGARRHARHVILFGVFEFEVLDGRAGGFADQVELSLERILNNDVVAATNEHLPNERLLGTHRGGHGHVFVDGHIPPTEHHLARVHDGSLHLLLAGLLGRLLLGQENHAHTVLPHGRELHTLQGHLFAVQGVGELNQNSGTVSHQFVGAHGTTVIEVF